MKSQSTLQCVRDFECKTKITTQPQGKGFATIPTGCVAAKSNKSADIYQYVSAYCCHTNTETHSHRWVLIKYSFKLTVRITVYLLLSKLRIAENTGKK